MVVLMMIGSFFYIAGAVAAFTALFLFDSDKWTGRFFVVFVAGGVLMVTMFSMLMSQKG